ncbi:BMP family ABC transporter substrate-binding protein [Alteromonas lipolytica]|uniref:BMP family ABC transporter substrate-binding protein n=2 Tax=Alteromonas lipolytica TaxID=1856405 RepID=A0A1E8FK18_9ALTE|nr:BMP family ABC transporter substrate-binding protein [Alteromonas lipolytica]
MFSALANSAPLKVAFIYVHPAGESGYSYTHDQARKYVEDVFGDKIEVTVVDSVPDGADVERVLMQLARAGHKLIFPTSFGYMNAVQKVARRYPKVIFEHASGYKQARNVGTYFDRIYEGRYLSGVIAGHMSKSKQAGYVAAYPIPEVIRGINAFTLGMRSVIPDATVNVVWVNSWYDPGKEREAADSLIQQGADVLAQHTNSPASIQAAEAAGVYAVGYHSDMSRFGKNAHLTAPMHLWNDFYVKRINQVLDGSWKPESVWAGFSENMTTLAPLNPAIPPKVVAHIESLKEKIKAGAFHPFTGPVLDQQGETRVPAGTVMNDDALSKMDFYVEGVQGKLPR